MPPDTLEEVVTALRQDSKLKTTTDEAIRDYATRLLNVLNNSLFMHVNPREIPKFREQLPQRSSKNDSSDIPACTCSSSEFKGETALTPKTLNERAWGLYREEMLTYGRLLIADPAYLLFCC